MSERKLLFLMNAEQALAFARLVEAAERGDGAAACRTRGPVPGRRGWIAVQPAADVSLVLAQCAGAAMRTGNATWARATSTGSAVRSRTSRR